MMLCPFCNKSETKVLESRVSQSALRRRRECLDCSSRFTTYERAEFSLNVIKRDGRMQPYSEQKIAGSISKALGKSDVEVVRSLTRKIEGKVLSQRTKTIKTSKIGRFVLQELKRFDKLAYIRYTTIHKQMDDPKLLEKEINLIAK